MHSAPAVRYPVPRSARAGRVLAALCGLPAVACLLWWQAGVSAPALAAFGAAWVLAATICVFQWHHLRAGRLRWDGQAWFWLPDAAAEQDEHAVTIQLRLDLQSVVLVHMKGAPGMVDWRWLERSAAPQRWNDLRRALVQRRPAAAHVPALDRP